MRLAGRIWAMASLLAATSVAAAPPPLPQRDDLIRQANALITQGDLVGAEIDVEQEVGLARQATAASPSDRAVQRDLLLSLNKLAWLEAAQSDLPDALTSYDEAIGVAERLAAANPASTRAALDVA